MAKCPNLEEAVTEIPSDPAEREVEAGVERVLEVDSGGLKEEVDTARETINSGHVNSPVQGATAKVAKEEELDDDSFWALLLRAGYTSW